MVNFTKRRKDSTATRGAWRLAPTGRWWRVGRATLTATGSLKEVLWFVSVLWSICLYYRVLCLYYKVCVWAKKNSTLFYIVESVVGKGCGYWKYFKDYKPGRFIFRYQQIQFDNSRVAALYENTT